MSTKTILLIDDEYRLREVTKMTLEMMAGWNVVTAASGREGLELARSQQPDAILLDEMMPDLDGTETLARLQADETTRSIPVLLLTAKAQTTESIALNRGARGVISKPFDPLELATTISEALGWG
ncbi:response regulator [Oscillatoriales cyanobacterium LEGE 11467]|uniref:Response regulator n=1 Tax=Zarconia navalis LEGE 11467 TaxID=1828826 RepID=A0A928VZG0_9CYAN|nr:response regulator [Zarconia navalis]MBE9041146.1 response regulator [Zarconia navalis LEGE 11467]